MRGVMSLTEAVKQVATKGASMTDRVKEAAREGADCTVISFPRSGLDGRHDTLRNLRHPWGPAPGPDSRSAPTPGLGREPGAQESESAISRRAGGKPKQVNAGPIALGRASPLATIRFLAIGVRLAGIAILSFLSLVATPSVVGPDRPALATTQKRVALVIGNAAYRDTRKLDNPRNDATDISAALKKLGYHVIEGFDLDKAALEAKIREFTAFLRGADVGVFFYAGHGLHVSGHNYLVPIDARLTSVPAPDIELVRLDLVHRTMEREAQTNILFFDACRDNPLSDNLARAMGTRLAEIGRGLAVVDSGAGTLISFATQPGKVALDGKGRNSPYSAALVRQLLTSSDDLASMLIAVRNDVMKVTDGKQVPWEHSALIRRFHFNPAPEISSPGQGTHLRSREAFDAWSATRDTASIALLEAFVARYRDTYYADLALARMEELRRHETAGVTSPTPR